MRPPKPCPHCGVMIQFERRDAKHPWHFVNVSDRRHHRCRDFRTATPKRPEPSRWLIAVDAPWCCAAAEVANGALVRCAPILRHWFHRHSPREAVLALRAAGARVTFIAQPSTPEPDLFDPPAAPAPAVDPDRTDPPWDADYRRDGVFVRDLIHTAHGVEIIRDDWAAVEAQARAHLRAITSQDP